MLFEQEYRGYCRHGIGYLYRDQRTENKCHRDPLPFRPPAVDPRRVIRLVDGRLISASDLDKYVKPAPPNYSRDYSERLKFAERMERPASVSKKERNASEPHKHTLHLKPDSKMVRLYWARMLIAWHYLEYWTQPLAEAAE